MAVQFLCTPAFFYVSFRVTRYFTHWPVGELGTAPSSWLQRHLGVPKRWSDAPERRTTLPRRAINHLVGGLCLVSQFQCQCLQAQGRNGLTYGIQSPKRMSHRPRLSQRSITTFGPSHLWVPCRTNACKSAHSSRPHPQSQPRGLRCRCRPQQQHMRGSLLNQCRPCNALYGSLKHHQNCQI